MKRFAHLLLLLLLCACEDPSACTTIDCGTNGTCVETQRLGSCVCFSGWTGIQCLTRQSTAFVGNYSTASVCTNGSASYPCNIAESMNGVTVILFSNLADSAFQVQANLHANGTDFTIPNQAFGTGIISGTGSINGSQTQVLIDYTILRDTTSIECVATLTRL